MIGASPIAGPELFVLTAAQLRIWYADEATGTCGAYNIPVAWRVAGALDRTAIEGALNALLERHAALRTRFVEVAGMPMQQVLADARIALRVLQCEPGAGAGPATEAAMRHEAQTPFQLDRELPIRASLLQLGSDQAVFLLTLHHVVADGWSVGLLLRDLAASYAALAAGAAPALPALPLHYAHYLAQQALPGSPESSAKAAQARLYWQAQLAGAPALALPTDRRRCASTWNRSTSRPCASAPSRSLTPWSRRATRLPLRPATSRCSRRAWRRSNRQMPAQHDGVPFCDFWLRVQTLLFGDFGPIVELAATLRERWGTLLAPFMQDGARRVSLQSDDIAAAVLAAFPSHDAGWNLARYQCPDLMFCAPDASALLRGQFMAVMGEVHLGGNTVGTNWFVSQHPNPAGFFDAMRSDPGHPYVLPKLSPTSSGTPIRTQWVDDPEGCTEVLFSSGLVPANRATAVPISELMVCLDEQGLVVRRPGHAFEARMLDVLGDFLSLSVMNRFGLLKKGLHTPRITIDKLVVQREAWQFRRDEISALLDVDEPVCFLNFRAWATRHQVPATVFAKVPWVDEPFFLDFTSPMFVRLFAKQIRRADELGRDGAELVSVSEMLPGFEHLWLTDTSQQAFTSGLRVVCIRQDDVNNA
jgi:hypothetical protein